MAQRVGKFEIIEELGRGGMGVVYKAVDPGIGREVALKVLPPSHTQSEELRERFLREARAAGRLQHPNIVVIHDLGEDQGNLYIAMEYLEGETLAQRIAREQGRTDVASALEVMAQVARGLNYAHQRGVVHRDIKPANILVTNEGVAKILDFGIARAGDQRMTKTGQVMGTIFYMSPEQINGQALDGRSDLFSAGIVLYELLTGDVPFEAESTGATMMKILTAPAPPLSERAPMSPPVLEEILACALAKQPAERYANAAEFAAALEAAKLQCAKLAPAKPLPATQPAKKPETLPETVRHEYIELEPLPERTPAAGIATAGTAPALEAAGQATPVQSLQSTRPVTAPVAAPAIPFRWWHVVWPRMGHELGGKVACRVSAASAFAMALLYALVTVNVANNGPAGSTQPLGLGIISLGYAVVGVLLTRFSRVAAGVLVVFSAVMCGALFVNELMSGLVLGTPPLLLALAGMRGSLAYHRARQTPGPSRWWHVLWPSADDSPGTDVACRIGAAAMFVAAGALTSSILATMVIGDLALEPERVCLGMLVEALGALTFLLLGTQMMRRSLPFAVAAPVVSIGWMMVELEYGIGELHSRLDHALPGAMAVLAVMAMAQLVGIRGAFVSRHARQQSTGYVIPRPRWWQRLGVALVAYAVLGGAAYLFIYDVQLPIMEAALERALLREQPEIKPYLRPVLGVSPDTVPGYYAGNAWNSDAFKGSKIEVVLAEDAQNGIATPLKGCFGFHRPLSGSGKVTGSRVGGLYSFSVESPEWTISFSGTRKGKAIDGTYTAKSHAGGPEQQGTFELARQTLYGLNEGFTAENCPTDDVIR